MPLGKAVGRGADAMLAAMLRTGRVEFGLGALSCCPRAESQTRIRARGLGLLGAMGRTGRKGEGRRVCIVLWGLAI